MLEFFLEERIGKVERGSDGVFWNMLRLKVNFLSWGYDKGEKFVF